MLTGDGVLVSTTAMAWAWHEGHGMVNWAWHGDGWGQCYDIAVFRPLKFETLFSVSGVSKARGPGTDAGPGATVATRVPAVHYYRGFSLHQLYSAPKV